MGKSTETGAKVLWRLGVENGWGADLLPGGMKTELWFSYYWKSERIFLVIINIYAILTWENKTANSDRVLAGTAGLFGAVHWASGKA